MDPQAALGAQVMEAPGSGSARTKWRQTVAVTAIALLSVLLAGTRAEAADRYALIVTGASGGAPYAERYDEWRTAFVETLTSQFGYTADRMKVLAEESHDDVGQATRENVRSAVADFRRRLGPDDVLFVLLIGHGSGGDSDNAKFNLVGPDLSSAQWGELFRSLPSQLVFVNTAGGSFPFLEDLAGKNRVVITADDSPAQQFETVFPGYFLEALIDDYADRDKNGKVSIWEAFTLASDRVKRSFEEKGQLATERALLDDTGDGVGRESESPSADSVLARITYLQPDPAVEDTGDPALTAMLRRRASLLNDLERLRARKATLQPDEYDDALEPILVEIAQIDRRMRAGS
jgi:hypothetical protein